MTRAELQERVEMLERLLADARAERDRYQEAIFWALGEKAVNGVWFTSAPIGAPRYSWRRTLRALAFGPAQGGK